MIKNSLQKNSGMTLTELMIAVIILSVAFLGMMAAFGGVASSIQQSKLHTLASNLAQERMQTLKQISYYRLMVTTATAYRNEFDPGVPYDTGYYPPETVFEGGINFERLVHVRMASEVNGALSMTGGLIDTGMKAITVTVIWKQGNAIKKAQVYNVRSNPNTVMATAQITGYVKNTSNQPIPNATVTVAENMGWCDTTDTNGNYHISLYPGSYSIIASARGFFSQTTMKSAASNQTVSQDFSLGQMSSGTITSAVWGRDHLMISQVVSSTVSAAGVNQEFVELYNPTTSYIPLSTGYSISNVKVMYQGEDASYASQISLDYRVANSSIAPGAYFLIANTATITACGIIRTADAVYATPGEDIIKSPDAGGVGLQRSSDLAWIDRVGWSRNSGSKTAPLRETTGIDQYVGFSANEQYVRRTSTAGVTPGYGRGYDSNNNATDFIAYSPLTIPPRSSQDNEVCISGTPLIGAIITCNDDLSYPTVAVKKGTVPWAEFSLTEVSTGTAWSIMVTSGALTLEISSVAVTSNGQVVRIPNADTSPAWQLAGFYGCVLSSEATGGFICGQVADVSGGAISPAIIVKSGANQTTADTVTGRYILPLATGTYSLTVNPGNTNAQYISITRDCIDVNLGQITSDIDFTLSKGGQLRGWVTRDGTNALPGVSVVALDSNGVEHGQDVTKTDGKFLLINLATGTYTVQPVLDSGETPKPESYSATVTAGSAVFVGTFTITGALGRITGAVKENNKSISTGVLIIASTATISTPPVISASLSNGAAYYTCHSYENGTYALDVRGSTTTAYNVYAYYPKLSGQSAVILSTSTAKVSVTAGQTKAGVNFSW